MRRGFAPTGTKYVTTASATLLVSFLTIYMNVVIGRSFNSPGSNGKQMRRTCGVITFVDGQRSRPHGKEHRPRMRMPAAVTTRLESNDLCSDIIGYSASISISQSRALIFLLTENSGKVARTMGVNDKPEGGVACALNLNTHKTAVAMRHTESA